MNTTESPARANSTKDRVPLKAHFTQPRVLGCLAYLLMIIFGIGAYSSNLQKPADRLGLYSGILLVAALVVLAAKRDLEAKMGTLLDCLEKKGALTAEDRAAIGWQRPQIDPDIIRGAPWLLLIILVGTAVLIALGFLAVTCSR